MGVQNPNQRLVTIKVPRPEVAVGPPKPRTIKVAPEVTRPVTSKQRQAINRGIAKAQANVETKTRNAFVRQGVLKAEADAINRGEAAIYHHDPATGLTLKTTGVSGHSKVIVDGGRLVHRYTTLLGLGHNDEPLTRLHDGSYAEQAALDAATKAVTAPVVKALHIAAIPGEAIGKQVEKATGSHAAGFAGSILLDPTTYLTGGRARVAEELGAKEAARVSAKAAASGLTEDQARRMGERAARQVAKTAPTTRGVKVGVRVHVPFTHKTFEPSTSGKTSAKLLSSNAADKLSAPIRNALHETVAPDVRPAHLSPTEHDTIRGAVRDYKATRAIGYRDAIKLHRAVKKAVPTAVEQRQVIDAIERRTVSQLPDHLRPVAENLSRRFNVAYKEEAKRGLSHGRFAPQGPEDAQGYFPHVANEQLDLGPQSTRKGTTRVEPDHARTIRKPLATIRNETPHLFSEDVPTIAAAKAGKTSDRLALSDLWQHVANNAGRPLKPNTHVELGSGDAVYKVTPHGLEELGKDGKPDLKGIEKALSGKASGRFVVIHRGAVEDIKKAIGAHGLGDSLPERVWDRTQGFLKILTTIPNPGYHSRNLVGDTHNALLADTTVRDLARSARGMKTLAKRERFKGSAEAARGQVDQALEDALHRPLHLGKSEDSTLGRELQFAEQHGAINTGQAGAEYRDLLGGDPRKLGKLRAASQYREDLPRFATYLSARTRGMSPERAAEWSRFHHVAYDDLTDFERRIGRRFIPFYTWFARNTRVQATKLLTRPGKAATLGKVLDEAAHQSGFNNYQDYAGKNLADYQQKGLPFPIKVGGTVYNLYVGLPATDLNQLTTSVTEQGFNIGGRLTFFKAIPEVIANYSIFFRGPIQDDHSPLVPAPDAVGDLPDALRSRLGVAKFLDKRSGKRVWGWPAKVDYVARQLPQTGFLTQFGTSVAGSRGYDRKLGAISYATGAKITPVDPVSKQINDAYAERDQLQAKRDALRQRLGKTADGKYRKTAETDALQKQITALDQQIGKLRMKRNDPVESIPLNQRPKVKTEAQRAYEALTGGRDPKLQAEIDRAHKALTGGSTHSETDRAYKALTGG